jgi:hypothetical protein
MQSNLEKNVFIIKGYIEFWKKLYKLKKMNNYTHYSTSLNLKNDVEISS